MLELIWKRTATIFACVPIGLGFKVEEGARKEYANLDFKMLVDLSIVDMLLRYEMLPLTLDARFSKRTASFV